MPQLLDLSSDVAPDGIPPFPVKRWTREEYHRLADQGWFDDDKVELLDGWIVSKAVHNPFHDGMVSIAEESLRSLVPDGAFLRVQSSLEFELSEPEPDLAMVRGERGWFLSRHPRGDECLMVVEVAESSLSWDRLKADIYASAGVPLYLVIDLHSDTVEVYDAPDRTAGRYAKRRIFFRGSTIKFHVGGTRRTIPANRLLPPVVPGRSGDET